MTGPVRHRLRIEPAAMILHLQAGLPVFKAQANDRLVAATMLGRIG
jgi:hypothetical protein